VFLHWETLNRRFGICVSNKFLSHASQEINDGRDFISLVFESSANGTWINGWRE
jgi:hypothetical protein